MNARTIPRLLAIGSLPPPLGGTSVSFQVFCDEVQRHAGQVELDIIDAAPRQVKEDLRLVRRANIEQALRVLWLFLRRSREADQVLVVGSQQFLFYMGSLILVIARLTGKPCYFRSFGYLDRFYDARSPLGRWLFRQSLGRLNGLFVETRLVKEHLTGILGDLVHWVPGYRHMPPALNGFPGNASGTGGSLRLVYLSQVREEKGIFVLLESLRSPEIQANQGIQCDIFGPVFSSIADRFTAELGRTPNATYKGTVEPEDVVATFGRYDAFVFPTFWPGEGHSGVLMEAMMAGISVITTRHRSVPELVEDRQNGLLTEPRDAADLAEAICMLAADRQLLKDTAKRNWERRVNYAASNVVPAMLQLMGLDLNGRPNKIAEY